MQLAELSISNLNLYSPSNGEVICHEEIGYNEDATTLMGYWIQEIADQPFIQNPELKKQWDAYVQDYEEKNDLFPANENTIDGFFRDYDNPNWMVFKIQTFGMPGDVAWFVINMEPED